MANQPKRIEILLGEPDADGLHVAVVSISSGDVLEKEIIAAGHSRNPRQAVAFALEEVGVLIRQHGLPGAPDLVCPRCNAVHLQSAFELLPAATGGARQLVEATETEPAEVHEVRNCRCGSTIARRIS